MTAKSKLVLVGALALVLMGLGLKVLVLASAAVIDRSTALYVGMFLLSTGFTVARRMPDKRKYGLIAMALGALLVAYGLGYIG